jgi:hypothetical protein
MPNTIPNGSADIATFGVSGITDVSLPSGVEIEVDNIVFNSGASAYTITVPPTFSGNSLLTISGAGIVNNSGITQNFATQPSNNGGHIRFVNSANAGNMTSFVNDRGAGIGFGDSATAGYATFINQGRLCPGCFPSAAMAFSGSSTAGHSTIINAVNSDPSGYASFGGVLDFFGSSTAGESYITNEGAKHEQGNPLGALTYFWQTSNAGTATIISDGSMVGGGDGGFTTFSESSTASNATLIANSGTNGGGGGKIIFQDDSTGGTSRIEVFGDGSLDIIEHNLGIIIGSLTGTGNVFLGANKLGVSSNFGSTIFSGVITDGGSGGSLRKAGFSTLNLVSANAYVGGTTVTTGRLMAGNATGSATGSGPITINSGGVLGGTGAVAGGLFTVTTGGALLGGNAVESNGALSVGNTLTLNSGSIIQLVLGPSGDHSSLNRTGGTWTFAPNQRFTFIDVGAQAGFYDNIITGLAGSPGSTASWTITNRGFSATFLYDGAGNIDLNLTSAKGPVLQLTSAVSRKAHGMVGDFDIPLPLTGEPGVECRSSAGAHKLVFTFNYNLTIGNASVSSGTADISSISFAGPTMIVNLTGVSDAQKVTVTLENVQDSLGQVLPNKSVSMNVLLGDTTGNKSVNSSDISQTKARAGQAVNEGNFRSDTTVNGTINASDLAQVKANSGHAVPQL